MRYVFLCLLLLLSGCYYPYYGYPYGGGYSYPAYTPGYQPNYYGPNGSPGPYRGPPPGYGGPPPYPGGQQQYYGGAPQLQNGVPGPTDPQNCGTPYDPRSC